MVTATNRPDPSFAVAAITLLQSNSILEAAHLCASGVEHYPDYIGGYVLLASAYESLGQHNDAQLIREALCTRFPGLPALKSYVQSQPELVADVVPIAEEQHDLEQDLVLEEESTSESVWILSQEHTIEQEFELYDEPVIATDVEFDEEPATESELEHVEASSPVTSHPNVLRLIEMAPITADTRIIRSSSVRLIPGLEYTSLRFEGTRSRGRREIASLLDPPAFRAFHPIRRTSRPTDTQEPRKKTVTLEELAARLNDARLPRNTGGNEPEISREDFSAMQSPIMITETIARIYMQQGSHELAIEAFKALQKQKPEKADEFEKLIKECERKRA